jgi:hypothetical protein
MDPLSPSRVAPRLPVLVVLVLVLVVPAVVVAVDSPSVTAVLVARN